MQLFCSNCYGKQIPEIKEVPQYVDGLRYKQWLTYFNNPDYCSCGDFCPIEATTEEIVVGRDKYKQRLHNIQVANSCIHQTLRLQTGEVVCIKCTAVFTAKVPRVK